MNSKSRDLILIVLAILIFSTMISMFFGYLHPITGIKVLGILLIVFFMVLFAKGYR